MIGATGTIGQATVRALLRCGHQVICFIRKGSEFDSAGLPGLELRVGSVTDARSVNSDGFRGEKFDIVVSCMASRSGSTEDAWAIDHRAHIDVLDAALTVGVHQMILLSAICVQKPRLAFQHAKLAFEAALIDSGITYSIVRPTAFFKSLSGQIERVKNGKPFLVFGDGTLTACKPVSDSDLANFLVDCIENGAKHNRILPVGGPGPAITPKMQGEMLFGLLMMKPRFKHVPVGLLNVIIGALDLAGSFIPAAARKADLARIGRYYATESMLVFDSDSGQYDPDATPETGTETLFDHYSRLVSGEIVFQRNEHSVF